MIDIVEPGLSRRRGLSLFETSTCHLQLGKQLYEAKRFSKTDFLMLLNAEINSLKECVKCLQVDISFEILAETEGVEGA